MKYDAEQASIFNWLNDKSFAEIQIEDTSGRMFHTSSLLGKTVYVDFWFTSCLPCLKEIPYAKSLYQFFKDSSDIVFLSICIEAKEKKAAWRKIINENKMPGIQLFYSLNTPQMISLPKEYKITYPTFLLVNKSMKVVGYDAPRPSETPWVHWAIFQAHQGRYLSEAYKNFTEGNSESRLFIQQHQNIINQLAPGIEK